jgi:ABC-2 type transport system ATP-binding protein/lipopolysaccharide transport system ATP-binding protein
VASIRLRDVSIEIPVYDIANSSIRRMILAGTVGGRFAQERTAMVVHALKSVSFEAADGDRIGLIGANGAGKTTLLRVLSGVYPPTRGLVEVEGSVSVMFNIMLGMDIDATGYDNIRICGVLWGLTRRQIDERFDAIADFTEIGPFLNMPVRTYSAGMRLRLAFAIATARDPDILLLDEAIGAGDAQFQQKAFARLKDMVHRSNILVVASHSNDIIRQICNRAVLLHQGSLIECGDVEPVLAAYQALGHTLAAADAPASSAMTAAP